MTGAKGKDMEKIIKRVLRSMLKTITDKIMKAN
jgi:hypothetical protein